MFFEENNKERKKTKEKIEEDLNNKPTGLRWPWPNPLDEYGQQRMNDHLRLLAKDAFFVSLSLFLIFSWFEWRNPGSINSLFTPKIPFVFACFSFAIILENKIKEYSPESKEKLSKIFFCIFLVSLITLSIGTLKFEFITKEIFLQKIIAFSEKNILYSSAVALFSSFVLFFTNKNKLTTTENEEPLNKLEKNKEEIESKKGKGFFVKITEQVYKNGWNYRTILILIIATGLIIRLWNLGKLGLTFDEGVGWLSVEMILKKGIPEFPTGILYNRGLPFYYLNSLFAYFLGLSEFSLRIISVISFLFLSIYSIKILDLLSCNKKTIVFFTFFINMHYWMVMFSRWSRMYMFTTALSVISLFYFLRYIKNKKNVDILLFTVIGFLAIGSHNSGYTVLMFIPLYLILKYIKYPILFFRKIKNNKKLIISFIILVFANFFWSYLTKLSPMYNNTEKQEGLIIQQVLKSFHMNLEYNNNSFPALFNSFWFFMPLFFLFAPFLFYEKIDIKKKITLIISYVILLSTLFVSVRISSSGSRLIFFQFIFYSLSIFITIDLLSKKIRYFLFSALAMSSLFSFGFLIPFINYGDKVKENYSSSHVLNFYPDNKTPALILSHMAEKNDIVIFYGYPLRSYPYLKDIKTEKIYQVSRTEKDKLFQKKDHYWGNNKIYSEEELDKLINEAVGNVFLISTFSVLSHSKAGPSLFHFRPELYTNILAKHSHEIIFESDDGVSKLLKINK